MAKSAIISRTKELPLPRVLLSLRKVQSHCVVRACGDGGDAGDLPKMATTDIAKPLGSEAVGESTSELPLETAPSRQDDSRDSEAAAHQLSTLLRRAFETPTREIDNLIAEFETLRERLQADANRIERDIVEYAELSHHVMQLTTIISETVRKIPRAPAVEKY